MRGTVGDAWEGGVSGASAVISAILDLGRPATFGLGPSHSYGSGRTVPTLGELGKTCFVLVDARSGGVPFELWKNDPERVAAAAAEARARQEREVAKAQAAAARQKRAAQTALATKQAAQPVSAATVITVKNADEQPRASNGPVHVEIYTPSVVVHQKQP